MLAARVEFGIRGQDDVKNFIEKNGATVLSVAKPSSQRPDLIFKYNKERLQCEIKQSNGFIEVTVFDQVVERGKTEFTMPNQIIYKTLRNLLRRRSRIKGTEFEEYVDYIRNTYGMNKAGFRGDDGDIPKSGRLLKEYFRFSKPNQKEAILDVIRNHWEENNDAFFILVDSISTQAVFFSTTKTEKILLDKFNAPPLKSKQISYIRFDSTGTAYKDGQIRAAIKLGLVSNELDIVSIK